MKQVKIEFPQKANKTICKISNAYNQHKGGKFLSSFTFLGNIQKRQSDVKVCEQLKPCVMSAETSVGISLCLLRV